VFGFAIGAGGRLQAVPGPVLTGSEPYSVAVDPSGRFLYLGQDDGTLAVFALNRANGSLKPISDAPFSFGGLQPEIAFAVP
jgi:6-phosphogluconolactonase (cycloisomerase 2 family)